MILLMADAGNLRRNGVVTDHLIRTEVVFSDLSSLSSLKDDHIFIGYNADVL